MATPSCLPWRRRTSSRPPRWTSIVRVAPLLQRLALVRRAVDLQRPAGLRERGALLLRGDAAAEPQDHATAFDHEDPGVLRVLEPGLFEIEAADVAAGRLRQAVAAVDLAVCREQIEARPRHPAAAARRCPEPDTRNELQGRPQVQTGNRFCPRHLLRRRRSGRRLRSDRHALHHLADAVEVALKGIGVVGHVVDDRNRAAGEHGDAQTMPGSAPVVLHEPRRKRGIRTRNLQRLDRRQRRQLLLLQVLLDQLAQQRLVELSGEISAEAAKGVDVQHRARVGVLGHPGRGLASAALVTGDLRIEVERGHRLCHHGAGRKAKDQSEEANSQRHCPPAAIPASCGREAQKGAGDNDRTSRRLAAAFSSAPPRTSALSVAWARGWFGGGDRKSTRLNSSHPSISYAVFCLKKKKKKKKNITKNKKKKTKTKIKNKKKKKT